MQNRKGKQSVHTGASGGTSMPKPNKRPFACLNSQGTRSKLFTYRVEVQQSDDNIVQIKTSKTAIQEDPVNFDLIKPNTELPHTKPETTRSTDRGQFDDVLSQNLDKFMRKGFRCETSTNKRLTIYVRNPCVQENTTQQANDLYLPQFIKNLKETIKHGDLFHLPPSIDHFKLSLGHIINLFVESRMGLRTSQFHTQQIASFRLNQDNYNLISRLIENFTENPLTLTAIFVLCPTYFFFSSLPIFILLTTLIFVRVKLARLRQNSDKFYAIKIIKRHHVEKVGLSAFKQILKNEVILLQKLDHPHIIRLVEYNVEGELYIKANGTCTQIYFIVLELIEQGDLFSFIQTTTQFKGSHGGFSERFARYYFQQLISAMEYLHKEANVVHRDLKPENLLINGDYDLKIADFGLSTEKGGANGLGIHYSQVGTRQYQAPEVLENRQYRGELVDIFSLGVILFVMVAGAMPYHSTASVQDQLYNLIYIKDFDAYWKLWASLRQRQICKKDEIEQDRQTKQDLFIEKGVWTEVMEAAGQIIQQTLTTAWTGICWLALTIKLQFFILVAFLCPQKTTTNSDQGSQTGSIFVGDFSPEFKDLVNHMMAYDSNERLTLEQIKHHPWTTRADDLPSVEEVQEQMAKLKKQILVKELQNTKQMFEQTHTDLGGNESLPTSLREYVNFMYRTNNRGALLQGLGSLGASFIKSIFCKAKCVCCSRNKNPQQNNAKLLNLSMRESNSRLHSISLEQQQPGTIIMNEHCSSCSSGLEDVVEIPIKERKAAPSQLLVGSETEECETEVRSEEEEERKLILDLTNFESHSSFETSKQQNEKSQRIQKQTKTLSPKLVVERDAWCQASHDTHFTSDPARHVQQKPTTPTQSRFGKWTEDLPKQVSKRAVSCKDLSKPVLDTDQDEQIQSHQCKRDDVE